MKNQDFLDRIINTANIMKAKKEIYAPSYLGFTANYRGFKINNLEDIEDVFLVVMNTYIDSDGNLSRGEDEMISLHFFADEKSFPKDFLKPRETH